MGDIRNESQLKVILNQITEEVIEVVSLKVQKKLQDSIYNFVYYFDYYPNVEYEDFTGRPSFEFLYAFKLKDIKKVSSNISRELYYAWEGMTINKQSGRHWSGKDMRKKLADALNVTGVFGRKMRGSYWEKFIEEMFNEGFIEKNFTSEFKKRGVIK